MVLSKKSNPVQQVSKPTSKDFSYEEYPFYWIARAINLYTEQMKKILNKSRITVTGWRIGLILRQHEALSVSELSEICSFSSSRVTKTVYAMQERSLLRIKQSTSDGRVSEVSITPEGNALIGQLIQNTRKTVDLALDGLTDSELLGVQKVMAKVCDNLAHR